MEEMEVEVRAKLEDPEKIRNKLEDMGAKFREQKKQTDMVFKKKGEEKSMIKEVT